MTYNKPFNLADKNLSIVRGHLIHFMNHLIYRWTSGDPIPYIWGGQRIDYPLDIKTDPQNQKYEGLDCSGLCVLGLIHAGLLQEGYDDVCTGLKNRFKIINSDQAMPGDLVMFGRSRITHCAMLYNRVGTTWVMVEAGGGGRACTTPQFALKRNAYVRPAWVSRRTDFRCYVGVQE